MTEINYSVIIPHKNIPELLQRCIDSIPRRDDVQIIVVDDNSDPAKVDFENFPGKDDPYVELYFTKEGRGAGYARNVGLKYAKGKWLLFADADDFFNDNFTSYTDLYLNSDADIIFWDANSMECYTGKKATRNLSLTTHIHQKDSSKSEMWLRYIFGPPWCKMIRHQMVSEHAVVFDETPNHNDTMFSLLIGYHAKKIERNPFKLYCVTYREDSISSKTTIEKLKVRIRIDKKVSDFYKEHKLGLSVDGHFRALYEIKKQDKNVYKQEYNFLLKYYKRPFIEWNLMKIGLESNLKKICTPLLEIRRSYMRNKYK